MEPFSGPYVVNDFQVMEANGESVEAHSWEDTTPISAFGEIVIRTLFLMDHPYRKHRGRYRYDDETGVLSDQERCRGTLAAIGQLLQNPGVPIRIAEIDE